MKKLVVEKIVWDDGFFHNLKLLFLPLSWHKIDQGPWEALYPYRPAAEFQIAHTDEHICLHYSVQEEFVKGQYIRPNENVWEDSCVEFFLSLDNKQTYFNVEFNVLTAGLIGYGPAEKSARTRLSAADIDSVDAYTQLFKKDGVKSWGIFLLIPKKLFGLADFSGKTYHANFYKCGDGLPNPHFLAWNTIENDTPNFHLPEYFGEIEFR